MNKNYCAEIESLLYLSIDERNVEEQIQVDQHLSLCENCRALELEIAAQRIDLGIKVQASTELKSAVLSNVHQAILIDTTQKSGAGNIFRISLQLVAAACVLLFLFYGYEQFYSLRKINQLEMRMASQARQSTDFEPNQDKLLIINVFFSWNDIKNWLGAAELPISKPNQFSSLAKLYGEPNLSEEQVSRLDSTIKSELYTHLGKTKFINKERIKARVNNYLQEVSLATKIY